MKKAIFIIFIAAMLLFIGWNMHRAGMMNREHEDIVARADRLISRSEASLARWNHKPY